MKLYNLESGFEAFRLEGRQHMIERILISLIFRPSIESWGVRKIEIDTEAIRLKRDINHRNSRM